MSTEVQRTLQGEPIFTGEPEYLDGYIPSSLDSPHSSLRNGLTWLGMGFILASVLDSGVLIFGLSSLVHSTYPNPGPYIIIGALLVFICWVAGVVLIKLGRRDYHDYVKRTGRKH